jgi:phage shock protein A
LREKLDLYVQKHRTKDAGLEKSIAQLSDLVDRLRGSLRQAAIKLEEFQLFVERQADRWKLAEATGELAVLLKETEGGDVTHRFLHDEAIDAIRDSLNLSFSQIEQILQREEVRQIVSVGPR